MIIDDLRGAGRGPMVARDLEWTVVADVDDHDLLPAPTPWVRTHTVAPSNRYGTEYWPDSNVTIGVLIGT